MLVGLGPFRFQVPTYSVEKIARSVKSRVESQRVIGARPPTHLLGPDEETASFSSTFFPLHLNGGGLAQLEGVRAACLAQTPLMLATLAGAIYGRWVITEVGDERTEFTVGGVPQMVTVDMSITRYVPRGGGALF